jgi:hypothetical protein
MLYDGKGRPGRAPAPAPAAAAARGPKGAPPAHRWSPQAYWALSTDGGKTHIAATTLSAAAKDAAEAVEGFATRAASDGVETHAGPAQVSAEKARGRLQSHGIGGVQATHYDGHDYLPEKLVAYDAVAPAGSRWGEGGANPHRA